MKKTHRFEEPRPFIGMNPWCPEGELQFDSNFESGNLDMVIKIKDNEYDLYMRVDTNTKGHHQWFFFSVNHNVKYTNQSIKFNIVNFTKENSLYS